MSKAQKDTKGLLQLRKMLTSYDTDDTHDTHVTNFMCEMAELILEEPHTCLRGVDVYRLGVHYATVDIRSVKFINRKQRDVQQLPWSMYFIDLVCVFETYHSSYEAAYANLYEHKFSRNYIFSRKKHPAHIESSQTAYFIAHMRLFTVG